MEPSSGTAPTGATTASSDGTMVPNQLAQLVPTFDPAKDDVLVYGQKVQLLLSAWPSGKYNELGTRLVLGCSGSAFLKLQLHQAEVTGNDPKGIKRLVEILGGTWGQINLEKRYEYAERALYKCSQKADESADSYLARADIMWSELRARDIKLEDLEPYVTLRGSQLSPEDKKRVLMEVDAANSGKLTISKVAASIRMLGASFFHDMTGQRRARGKTYDQSALLMEHQEGEEAQPTMMADYVDEVPDEEIMETLIQEGDEDASLVADFEGTATDVVQSDPELASALTAYTEARRRLSEKFRSRGFWPPSHQSKGKHKGGHRGPKGKFGKTSFPRKSLQQRIMESRCRICNQYGHWKAECPQRGNGATGSDRPAQAPTSFVQTMATAEPSGLPLEFLQLPEHASTMDDSRVASCLVTGVDRAYSIDQVSKSQSCLGNSASHRRLQESLHRWKKQFHDPSSIPCPRTEKPPQVREDLTSSEAGREDFRNPSSMDSPSDVAVTCFATHGSLGVVDLGATKTVIGSDNVQELLDNLKPQIKKSIYRCPCKITFRFGNHGILQSEVALVVPIHGFHLKIAIVPGSTPFLLSNTLLRALESIIDTQKKVLYSKKVDMSVPLQLTSKGLFLLDLNDLASDQPSLTPNECIAETNVVVEPKPGHSFTQQVATTQGDVREELSTVIINQESSKETPERSIGWKKLSKGNMKSEENNPPSSQVQGDTQFARSFQFLDRSLRHVAGQPPPEDSSQGERAPAGLLQNVSGSAGPRDNNVWPGPQGPHVSRSLASRSSVGAVVHPALRKLQKGVSQAIPPLRGVDDRESRTGGRESSDRRAQQDTTIELSGSWETLPKGQGCTKGIRSGGRVGGGDRHPEPIRHGGVHAGTRECQHRAPRNEDAQPRECIDSSDSTLGDHGPSIRGLQDQSMSDTEGQLLLGAGEISPDITPDYHNIERCHEGKVFRKLLTQYLQEFDEIKSSVGNHCHHKRAKLFEVFCGPKLPTQPPVSATWIHCLSIRSRAV